MFVKRTLVVGDEPSPPQGGLAGPEPAGPPGTQNPNARHPMITIPFIITASVVGFIGVIATVAGTGRRSRGAHRA